MLAVTDLKTTRILYAPRVPFPDENSETERGNATNRGRVTSKRQSDCRGGGFYPPCGWP